MTIFALVDCNNFYVSCERVFNPRLEGRPVIVLSNNDGCAVARSEEARAAGVKMGAPVFRIKDLLQAEGVHLYSSNYALYGDMSRRVMETLSRFTPHMEIYSIDEAFLDLSGFSRSDLTAYARRIRGIVRKWTGIPVSVGVGETKTLAKIANRIAKKSTDVGGVLDLTGSPFREKSLEMTDVADVWGIGPRYTRFLKTHGITDALRLSRARDGFIRKRMGVNGTRTLAELRGLSCYPLEKNPPSKKGTAVSRTFKTAVESKGDLEEAIAAYVCRGGEKLRAENAAAGVMMVYIATSRFKKKFYFNMDTIRLPVATSDTAELIRFAREGLGRIYKKGFRYKKAGVVFQSLVPDTQIQADLFDRRDRKKSKQLMGILDEANSRLGPGSLTYAAAGMIRDRKWKTVFTMRSPSYTTDWGQLPEVR